MTDSKAGWGDQIDSNVETASQNPLLKSLVSRYMDYEEQIKLIDTQLKAARAGMRVLLETEIPNALEDLGLDDKSRIIVEGQAVSVDTKIVASPSKENKPLVLIWLEDNGHGGIIKRQAVFNVGLGQEKEAIAWMKKIKTYDGDFIKKVEPSTLSAFVRSQVEAGIEIPMDLFGAFPRRVATVKPI